MTTGKGTYADSVKKQLWFIERHYVGKALEIIYSNSVFIDETGLSLFIHSSIHAFDK